MQIQPTLSLWLNSPGLAVISSESPCTPIDGKRPKSIDTEGPLSSNGLSSEYTVSVNAAVAIEGSCWISNSTQASYVFRITHPRDRSTRTLEPLRTSFFSLSQQKPPCRRRKRVRPPSNFKAPGPALAPNNVITAVFIPSSHQLR